VTSIGVQAADGRARLTLTQGPISPRILRIADNGARIGLVATQALLLGGDHVRLDIEVGPGAWLELVETAGTVAYDADGAKSSWTVSIRVAEGGVLIWSGEPFVVSRGANVARSSTIELGEGAASTMAGVVDDDLGCPEAAVEVGEQLLHLGGLAGVAGEDLSAGVARQCGEVVRRARSERNLDAVPVQRARQRGAQARTGADDQSRREPLTITHHCLLPDLIKSRAYAHLRADLGRSHNMCKGDSKNKIHKG